MNPLPETEVVLVSNALVAPYSGMLPGRLAGWYSDEEMHFHLQRLCAQSGVTFVRDEVTGLDPVRRLVHLRERPSLYFDVASVNVGITPSLPAGAAGHPHVLAVKPISQLLEKWRDVKPGRWTVVGGGAAGFELSVIMALRGSQVTLLDSGPEILAGHGEAVQRRARAVLERHGVKVMTSSRVARVNGQELHLENGSVHSFEKAVFTTGATAPAWLKDTGLPVSPSGFLRVDEYLRCEGQTNVFAAGDCIDLGVPKAGVYAVREAPVLAENIRAVLEKRSLRRYRPQRKFLALLTSGEKRALMSYRGFALEGEWLWNWKDSIDRRFMERFNAQPVDPMAADKNTCGGCGGKVEPCVLHSALASLPRAGSIEDVGWLGRTAVTVDGFRTFTPDLHFFGRVASLHALNDLYAGGVLPQAVAVNATLSPAAADVRANQLTQLMAGVFKSLEISGAKLLNAHTSEAAETSLAIAAFGEGERRWSKMSVRAGQLLVLSKPVGTGACLQALMSGSLDEAGWEELRDTLLCDHHAAMSSLRVPVAAVTDISGFGLLGHLSEMLGSLGAEIEAVPVLSAFGRSHAQGAVPFISRENASYYAKHLRRVVDLPVIYDPQTHGPLLFAVEPAQVEALVAHLQSQGLPGAQVVGRVTEAPGILFN